MTTTPLSSNDEELREKLLDLSQICGDCEHPRCISKAESVMHLISEDRKAREAEIERLARIDEARLFHKKIVEKPYHHLDAACQGFMENNRLFAVYRIAELQPQGDKTE